MIIYFTGTGNSKYVADALADRLGDETVSLNEIMRTGSPMSFESDRPYVIVCPIFAWRIPGFVMEFLDGAEFKGVKKMYVVATMGANSGKADKYVEEGLASKDIEFMGFTGIPMVDNYIVWSDMPDEATVKAKLAEATSWIDLVAEAISKGERIHKYDKTRLAGLKSGFINGMFSKHADPGLSINESCTKCGKCVNFCPALNIVMDSDRPKFQGKCLGCLGCIQRCPVKAINIKGKTEQRGRYVCPEYVPMDKE